MMASPLRRFWIFIDVQEWSVDRSSEWTKDCSWLLCTWLNIFESLGGEGEAAAPLCLPNVGNYHQVHRKIVNTINFFIIIRIYIYLYPLLPVVIAFGRIRSIYILPLNNARVTVSTTIYSFALIVIEIFESNIYNSVDIDIDNTEH